MPAGRTSRFFESYLQLGISCLSQALVGLFAGLCIEFVFFWACALDRIIVLVVFPARFRQCFVPHCEMVSCSSCMPASRISRCFEASLWTGISSLSQAHVSLLALSRTSGRVISQC